MIKIFILTTTRAEYGLMRPLIQNIQADLDFELKLLVTGTHLSEKYGFTLEEIKKDNYCDFDTIEILSNSSGEAFVSETMGNAIVNFTKYFLKNRPDFILVDGDRYETLAVCIAAVNTNIPIIHCSGGATTEGAADECYRHAITKMSFLHFPTTETYRKRIIQMGESPDRVFTVGSMGIENILNMDFLSKQELETQIDFKLDKPFAVVTFHPVTLENNTVEEQVMELLYACEEHTDMKFIFTKANADNGGDKVNAILENFTQSHSNMICVSSLGARRYISALKYADFVMGNSSSGIIEAPSMHIPTINIGDRQKGRIQAESIINCAPVKKDILRAIEKAESLDFKKYCKTVINPNGDGDTTRKIIAHIKEYVNNNEIDIKKSFYDL